MGKKIFITIICLALFSFQGFTQNFLNLDFEYSVYKAQPRKWAIEGEGEMYNARLDSTTAKSGNNSLYITLKDSKVYTYLSIPGNLIAGKNIEIEGFIKFKNNDSLVTMLAFRNPNGEKPNFTQPIKGDINKWVFISHKASFPENFSSDRLLVALVTIGTGDFWFDNVTIKINGHEYGNETPDFREPSEKEIIDLNNMAIPVNPIESDTDLEDLIPLTNIIGKSTIIALGENSHGSSTIYKLKFRMVKYMVEKLRFSIFALESPMVEADRINDYVLNGKGTLNDVIKDLVYPSWQTQEMIDIIQWLRVYNQTAGNKVEFKGFDMQNGMSVLEAIEDFAKVNDTAMLPKLCELKKLYDDAKNEKQPWDKVYQMSEKIDQYLLAKNNSVYAGVGNQDFERISHYMHIFLESLSSQCNSEKTISRDEYMAQNIDWLIKNSGGRKIILSADNTHVTKADGKMGSFLSNWYGEKYIAFGFTYNSGTYSAYGQEKYYEVHPSYVGTYEYFFSKCKFDNFFLDLRSINNIDIFNSSAGFRSIGSLPQETTQFTEINLKKHFDAIVYTKNSKHTTLLTK